MEHSSAATALHKLQIYGLTAFSIGLFAAICLRRAPARGWVAIILQLVAAGAWSLIESTDNSRDPSIIMLMIFMGIAPIAIVYSWRARKTAPDRLTALAALVGSFLLSAFLLLMLGGIIYTIFEMNTASGR